MIENSKLPVSAICSVYSGTEAHELQLAVNSLLAQSSQPDQVIIVLDGPVCHATRSAVNQYIQAFPLQFSLLQVDLNQGLGIALKLGLHIARNELILRFDTDDISLPSRMAIQYKFMLENPEVTLVSSSVKEFKLHGRSIFTRLRKSPLTPSSINRSLLYRNPINHPSVFFRKTPILNVGSYEDIKYFEDYYLWLKLFQSGARMQSLAMPLVAMHRPQASARRIGLRYFKYETAFIRRVGDSCLIPVFFRYLLFFRAFARLFLSPFYELIVFFSPWTTSWAHDDDIENYIAHLRP